MSYGFTDKVEEALFQYSQAAGTIVSTIQNNYKIAFCKYGKLLSSKTFQVTERLDGSEIDDGNTLMLDDTNITEASKATVDAYVSIDSAQQFYDRAFSYLEDNFVGEGATIVSRNGDLVDAGALDVVVDAAALSAFAFDVDCNNQVNHLCWQPDHHWDGHPTKRSTVAGYYTVSNGTVTNTTLTSVGCSQPEVRIYEAGTTTEIAGVENSKPLSTQHFQCPLLIWLYSTRTTSHCVPRSRYYSKRYSPYSANLRS